MAGCTLRTPSWEHDAASTPSLLHSRPWTSPLLPPVWKTHSEQSRNRVKVQYTGHKQQQTTLTILSLTCPGALALIQHPLVSAESAVEPHGVVQRGWELDPVAGIRQQCCSQERVIWHISGNTAVQLHAAFTYISQTKKWNVVHHQYRHISHIILHVPPIAASHCERKSCNINIWKPIICLVTDMSSCSHPEQLLWLSCSVPVKVWWVYWLYLNRDLISQQFVETLSCSLCQVRFAVTRTEENRSILDLHKVMHWFRRDTLVVQGTNTARLNISYLTRLLWSIKDPTC